MIQTKGKIKGTVNKDSYEAEIEIEEYGVIKGMPTRFVNEPQDGDEVWCIIFDEVYLNECIYIPLNILGDQFIGMARQGFKIEFTDSAIDITSSNSEIKLEKDKINVKSGTGQFDLDGSLNKVEISGFSMGIKMSGVVGPNTNGPFCSLPNCLFTGALHSMDTVMSN